MSFTNDRRRIIVVIRDLKTNLKRKRKLESVVATRDLHIDTKMEISETLNFIIVFKIKIAY